MNAPFHLHQSDLLARMGLGCHRFPWTEQDEGFLIRAKRSGGRHKIIARKLQRTPRSVDQHVARLRERGVL